MQLKEPRLFTLLHDKHSALLARRRGWRALIPGRRRRRRRRRLFLAQSLTAVCAAAAAASLAAAFPPASSSLSPAHALLTAADDNLWP